ncbi:hypothetical protein [Lysinibacillus sp. 54212]|uniref:hypothetical protein n=1 Tax=Lysinibacillus sp. 54212 TaxID=3119829 RepID=UPI002FCA179C
MELVYLTPAELTIVVEGIESRVVKTADSKYKIGENVKAILNEANAMALAGATLHANVVRGEITNITVIELNTSSEAGTLVTLDGGNTIYLGNIIVNADNVELKNLIVIGSITLTSKAATRFVTKRLEVKGELVVERGETSRTASLFHLPSIPMPELSMVLFTSFIAKLEISRAGVSVNSNFPITMLKLTDQATETQLNRDTKVEIMVIPDDTHPPLFICNFNNICKNIGRILTNTGSLVFYQLDWSGDGIPISAEQALEEIDMAAESYWQKVDSAHVETETIEEYYISMNKSLSLFQSIFEQNAEIAGFNMTRYNKLSVTRRKEALFEWLLLWNITIDDFSEIITVMEESIGFDSTNDSISLYQVEGGVSNSVLN